MFCWLFKFTISHHNAGKLLWPITQQHLKRCSDCRKFYNFCLLLDKELSAEEKDLSHDLPVALHERIMSGIKNINIQTSNTHSITWSAVVAAVLVFIILLSGIYSLSTNNVIKAPVNLNNADAVGVTKEPLELIVSSIESIERIKPNGLPDNSLKVELHRITKDSGEVVNFIFGYVNMDITDADEEVYQ
jgi:hypothetical protein